MVWYYKRMNQRGYRECQWSRRRWWWHKGICIVIIVILTTTRHSEIYKLTYERYEISSWYFLFLLSNLPAFALKYGGRPHQVGNYMKRGHIDEGQWARPMLKERNKRKEIKSRPSIQSKSTQVPTTFFFFFFFFKVTSPRIRHPAWRGPPYRAASMYNEVT